MQGEIQRLAQDYLAQHWEKFFLAQCAFKDIEGIQLPKNIAEQVAQIAHIPDYPNALPSAILNHYGKTLTVLSALGNIAQGMAQNAEMLREHIGFISSPDNHANLMKARKILELFKPHIAEAIYAPINDYLALYENGRLDAIAQNLQTQLSDKSITGATGPDISAPSR
jgi:hypothetical protein